jgi:hypothetical protein
MVPRTVEELDETVRACKRMATRAAVKSAFVGALPVPLLDAAIDVKILARLITRINERFGLAKDQMDRYHEELRLGLFDLIKRYGARFAGRYVTLEVLLPALRRVGIRITSKRAARYIPILGTGLTAAISFSAMKAVAHAHIRECETVVRYLMEERA